MGATEKCLDAAGATKEIKFRSKIKKTNNNN